MAYTAFKFYDNDRRVEITAFHTTEQMVAAADESSKRFENGDNGYDTGNGNLYQRKSFIGRKFENFEEVVEAVHEPWADGITILNRMMDQLQKGIEPPKSRKRRPVFDEFAGDEVDMDRLRSGQLFWRGTIRENREAPQSICVFFDVTTSGYCDPEEVLWRGAAAIVLAYKLEQAGYRVELWAVNGSEVDYGRGTKSVIALQLKKYSDVLDISTIVQAVSGWFYRTVIFTTKVTIAKGRTIADGYGHCYTPREKDLDHLNDDPNRAYAEGIMSESSAVSFVQCQIARFNTKQA